MKNPCDCRGCAAWTALFVEEGTRVRWTEEAGDVDPFFVIGAGTGKVVLIDRDEGLAYARPDDDDQKKEIRDGFGDEVGQDDVRADTLEFSRDVWHDVFSYQGDEWEQFAEAI